MTVPSFRTMGVALTGDVSDLESTLRRATVEVDRFARASSGAFDRVDTGMNAAIRDFDGLGRSMDGAFKSAKDSASAFEEVELQERALYNERAAAEREMIASFHAREQAARSAVQVQMQAEKEMAADFEQRARKREESMNRLGRIAVGVGVALGAGVGVGIDRFATFDQQISAVQAATHETEGNMRLLSEASLQAGQDTVFSATESAAAVENLAKAGVGTSDILSGALRGSLNLAAAGTLDVAYAAEIAATAMTQFGKGGEDVPHIADLLAAAAGKAQGEVSDMAEALKFVGPVTAGMNVSLEETVGTLALFAQQGVIGEQAGTGLRGMLASLTSPSAQAAQTMDNLGISLYDANGDFIGIAGAAEQLRNGLKDLTGQERDAALGMIFGNQQVTAARILYKGGADAVAGWTASVNDAGYASETAGIKLDNLKGDVEQFSGALETSLIKSGTSANGVLRELLQTGTGVLNVYSDLPGPVQATGTVLTTAASAAGLLSGAFILGAPKIGEFKRSIADMGPRAAGLSRGLLSVGRVLTGPLGIGLAASTVAFAIWANKHAEAKARVAALADTLDKETGALTANTREWAVNELTRNGALAAAREIGLSADLAVNAFLGEADAIDAVNVAIGQFNIDQPARGMNEAGRAADSLSQKLGLGKSDLAAARRENELYREAMGDTEGATDDTTRATDAYGNAIAVTTEATEQAREAAEAWQKELADLAAGFVTPLDAYQQTLQAKEEAERASAEATADATKSGKDSWEDYTHQVSVSIDEYLDKLTEQVTAQENWRTNLLLLSTRVSSDTLQALERLGPEGAPLVAQFVDASAKELRRANRLFGKATAEAAGGIAAELIAAGPVLQAVAEQDGQKVADGYARRLAQGRVSVEEIAAQYGLALEENIPGAVETKVSVSGAAQAKRVLRELAALLEPLQREADIRIGVGRFAGKAVPVTAATGGWIRGPGSSTSDSIEARLSDGEFVTRTRAVDYYGPGVYAAMNRMSLPKSLFSGVPGFRDGGLATRSASPQVTVVTVPVTESRTNTERWNVTLHGDSWSDLERQLRDRADLNSSPGSMFGGR